MVLKITVFYEDIREDYDISSSQKLMDLRKIINDNHVPFKSQILNVIESHDKKIEIEESRNEDLLG